MNLVFGFASIAVAVATVMFAVLPSLQATRVTLTQALRGELGLGVRNSRLRGFLVAGQVAVSVVLSSVAHLGVLGEARQPSPERTWASSRRG